MSLFWYPEINDKYDLFGKDGKADKTALLSSYIRYYLARVQSMFKYNNLPDTIPAKWLENYLLCNGAAVWIKTEEDGLIVTRPAIGGTPDLYYIPTEVIVSNPYIKGVNTSKTYQRDIDCVLMVNDTYAQGILPLLKKYCSLMVENDITMGIADIMVRASLILSAADDNTKNSAELFLQRLFEGRLGVIGETPFLVANQDKSLSINNIANCSNTLTDLIEYHQYLKASLYNDLGLQSNYNMKREAINSNESQLNEDMLHPFIDDMLRERQEGLDKVNKMFGTDITVEFNSAWEINEREEEAAIETMEAEAKAVETPAEGFIEEDTEAAPDVEFEEDQTEETPEEDEAPEEVPEVSLTDETIETIADEVVEKLEGDDNENENS